MTNPFRRKLAAFAPVRPSAPEPYELDPLDNHNISPPARQLLAEWLNQPMTKTAMRILAAERPTTRVRISGNPEADHAAELRRLHLLQGWDLYHETLLSVRHSPADTIKHVAETYPQS